MYCLGWSDNLIRPALAKVRRTLNHSHVVLSQEGERYTTCLVENVYDFIVLTLFYSGEKALLRKQVIRQQGVSSALRLIIVVFPHTLEIGRASHKIRGNHEPLYG